MAPKNWRPVAASLTHVRLKPQAVKLPSPNTTAPESAAKANCQRGRSPLLTGVDLLCGFWCEALRRPASNSSTKAACCVPDCLDIAKATPDAFSASWPAIRAARLASSRYYAGRWRPPDGFLTNSPLLSYRLQHARQPAHPEVRRVCSKTQGSRRENRDQEVGWPFEAAPAQRGNT